MPLELPKAFDPREAQLKWLQFWNERGFGHSEPDPNRKPFTIVIPPPNVTGALHMGHALDNTLQDANGLLDPSIFNIRRCENMLRRKEFVVVFSKRPRSDIDDILEKADGLLDPTICDVCPSE